ncbi:MAG: sugar transferase [Anaerolineae bacterium]|nr:sugar transferase [Anaerolineae bacterium]
MTDAKNLEPDAESPIDAARPRSLRISLPSLRLRVSERRLLLYVVDTLAVNVALLVASLLRGTIVLSGNNFFTYYYIWFIVLTIVWSLCALFFDIYNLARAASLFHSVRNAAMAAFVTAVIYTFIPLFTPPLQSRVLLMLFAAFAVGGVAAWRVLYARLFVQPWFKQRALVVGAGWAGRTLVQALKNAPAEANPFRGTGYELVGFVDDNPGYQGGEVEDVPVLGGRELLVELAQELQVDEIVLAITHRHAIVPDLFDALLRCRELGFRVTTMSMLYERLLGRVPVDHVGRDLQMVMPMGESVSERFYLVIKRLIDIVSGVIGVAILGLLMPFLALANAVSSPGPLFYRQQRVGRAGKPFDMFKFRSMIPNAEAATGAVWASNGDMRITPVGHFIRKTRIDELPQFINVLRGEMSLVGPRPERPEFVDELARTIPFYRARHAVKPGITGWAQVQFDYGDSVEDAQVKLEYDLYYVKYTGLFLDLRIMLQTIPVMLRFGGQ